MASLCCCKFCRGLGSRRDQSMRLSPGRGSCSRRPAYLLRSRRWRSSWLNWMPLVWWVIRRSRTAQTKVRQLASPGNRPITLVRLLASPRGRSRRLVDRHRRAVSVWAAEVHGDRVPIVGETLRRGDESRSCRRGCGWPEPGPSVSLDEVCSAGRELVWLRPEVGDPGDHVGLIDLEEA